MKSGADLVRLNLDSLCKSVSRAPDDGGRIQGPLRLTVRVGFALGYKDTLQGPLEHMDAGVGTEVTVAHCRIKCAVIVEDSNVVRLLVECRGYIGRNDNFPEVR